MKLSTVTKLFLTAFAFIVLGCPVYGQNKVNLAEQVKGILGTTNGGWGQVTPTPVRAGDVFYWNGSAWVTLAGNNSSSNCLTENSSGVPSWATCGAGGSVPTGTGFVHITGGSQDGAARAVNVGSTDITGVLAATNQAATTVNAVTNDTNVTGSISLQNLTLGWTGTLAKGRTLATTVYTDQSNAFSTGTQDFSAVGLFKARVGAGLTSSINGDIGYDTTNKNWHLWDNSVDSEAGVFPTSLNPVNGNCVQWVVSGGVITLGQAGSCGNPPCVTTPSSLQYDNAGVFGCVPDFTYNGVHTLVVGASGVITLSAGAGLNGLTVAMLPTAIPNANLANPSVTVNSQTCTLGSACSITYPGISAGAIASGTTATTQSCADNTTKLATDAFVLGCGTVSPMTTLGDETYGGVAGAFTRLAGPTGAGTWFLVDTTSSGAATAEVFAKAGVVPNPVTTTSYTYKETDAVNDRAAYTSFSNASATAVTLPSAATLASNFVNVSCNIGAGTVTITPTTSTISYTNGSAYTSAATSVPLTTGNCITIYSDNANYFAILRTGGASLPFSGLTSATNTTAAMLVGTGASLGVTGSGTINATSVNSNTFPASAGLTSGGVLYASSTSAVASSAALTVNVLVKGGGAGSAPSNSLITDNGTTATYTGTGGFVAPLFTSNGSGAGALVMTCGTAQGHGTVSTVTYEAPASCTAYEHVIPGTSATGIPLYTNAANVLTESIVASAANGDLLVGTGTTWAKFAGNSSGTQCLTESSSGVASWGACGGSAALSAITAAAGSNTIANGNNPQVWNWAQTTASQTAFTFGETTAATGSGDVELGISTAATSVAIPFKITQGSGLATTGNAVPAFFNATGGAGGAVAVTATGNVGGFFTATTGAGSAGGATSGTGGAGGDFLFTTGAGGAATAGSTTGRGGNYSVTLGAAGGTGTLGAPGQFLVIGSTVGGANTTPFINLTGTWNTSGVVDAAIFANITNTSSGALSKLIDLQIGSVSQFNVDKSGNENILGALGIGASPPACTAGTAGAMCFTEGTVFTNVASTAGIYADGTAHEFKAQTAGSALVGTLVRAQPGAVRSTGLVASVSTATLCAASAGACNVAGTYHVHIALYQSGAACTTNTTGGVTPTLTWTDGNGTAHSAIGIPLETNSSLVALTGTMLFNQTGSGIGTVFGSGDINIDTNGSIIQYAIGFAQCSVSGTATYAASLVVDRLN